MKHWFALVLFGVAFGVQAEGVTSAKPAEQSSDYYGRGRGYGYGYGALAFDVNTRSWAYVINSSDKVAAQGGVTKLCGSACTTFGHFEQCGVVVTNGVSVGYGVGADKSTAENNALKQCGERCDIAVWGCNQASVLESAGFSANTSYRRNYGAITFNGENGAYSAVWDYASFADAVRAARGACGNDCRIYISQAGGCGVLVRGRESIAIGSGVDYKTAEENALAKCSGDTCSPVTWFCNSQ